MANNRIGANNLLVEMRVVDRSEMGLIIAMRGSEDKSTVVLSLYAEDNDIYLLSLIEHQDEWNFSSECLYSRTGYCLTRDILLYREIEIGPHESVWEFVRRAFAEAGFSLPTRTGGAPAATEFAFVCCVFMDRMASPRRPVVHHLPPRRQ
jgi:hypothetical protein